MLKISERAMDDILANSFRDFHAKGFDYICLKRIGGRYGRYLKLYFFDNEAASLPEVVHPHNHRYDAFTWCLAGQVTNHIYSPVPAFQPYAERWERYDFYTPLNNGGGFTYRANAFLHKEDSYTYSPTLRMRKYYGMAHDAIHTISVTPGTVLLQRQYEDVVPLAVPTQCFLKPDEPIPQLGGLYRPFTADEVTKRLAVLLSGYLDGHNEMIESCLA